MWRRRGRTAVEPVFESVDRPGTALAVDDVSACELCGSLSPSERALMEEHFGRHCVDCRGYRMVHGYASEGSGLPARLVGWRVVAPARGFRRLRAFAAGIYAAGRESPA